MQKKFSFPIKISELNRNQYEYVLEADKAELQDITNVLQVEKVLFFKGEVYLKLNLKQHILKVWGTVSAKLELKSVISLENFRRKYKIPFELIFDTKAKAEDFRNVDINEDVPDVIENGTINLADICIEQVALNLEDYPREEGEVFDFSQYVSASDYIDEKAPNPFAVLKKIKK